MLVIVVAGAIGYYYIEPDRSWSIIDAVYMAVITVSTVGLKEVHILGPAGRAFTIVLILFGVGAFMYLATALANYFIAGELQGVWGQRRMEKKIANLSGHYIVCGYGRMGREVAQDFKRQHLSIVVIDRSEDAVGVALSDGYLAIVGDAGDDDVLRQAGVERARALVTTIDDDASCLMVALSARALNEELFIVSRANAEHTESKLVAAGADRVLWPYGLGGRRMAQMALRPNVVEFLEIVMHDEELELWLEEVTIAIGSELEGATLGSGAIRERTGAMLVAIRQRTGNMLVAPSPDTALAAGDIVVSLGTRAQLEGLRRAANRT